MKLIYEDKQGPSSLRISFPKGMTLIRIRGEVDMATFLRIARGLDAGPTGSFRKLAETD